MHAHRYRQLRYRRQKALKKANGERNMTGSLQPAAATQNKDAIIFLDDNSEPVESITRLQSSANNWGTGHSPTGRFNNQRLSKLYILC